MAAQTLFKMSPADHQALQVLLKYLSKQVTADEFLATLTAQGRSVRGRDPNVVVFEIAEYLVRMVA